MVKVGGMPLEEFCRSSGVQFDAEQRQRIDHEVRRAAYAIIEGKGATYYGIGSALARIVDVIPNDQRAILTVSSIIEKAWGEADVTFSLPRLVGGGGILATFPPVLTDAEEESLHASARVISEALEGLSII